MIVMLPLGLNGTCCARSTLFSAWRRVRALGVFHSPPLLLMAKPQGTASLQGMGFEMRPSLRSYSRYVPLYTPAHSRCAGLVNPAVGSQAEQGTPSFPSHHLHRLLPCRLDFPPSAGLFTGKHRQHNAGRHLGMPQTGPGRLTGKFHFGFIHQPYRETLYFSFSSQQIFDKYLLGPRLCSGVGPTDLFSGCTIWLSLFGGPHFWSL